MRYHLILLCLCLITWQNRALDTGEEFDINEDIDMAISNSDAALNELSVVSYDEKSSDANEYKLEPIADSTTNRQHVPVDGNFSKWHSEQCSRKCDGGVKTLTRTCNNPFPAFGGKPCTGCVSEVKICNTQQCPVDGKWSKWEETKCPCGVKTKTRTRTCSNPKPAYKGNKCAGVNKETVPCKKNPCPVNGGWTNWRQTPCTKTCGGGKTTRTRRCANPEPKYGGKSCSGDESLTKSCNTKLCPVNGNWSPWTEYERCSKSCAGGTKLRNRHCNNPSPAHGGNKCSGKSKESANCNAHPCPKYSCSKQMDFIFLLDSSRITPVQWKKEVKFAERMIDTIYRKFADAKISLLRFGNKGHTLTKFTGVDLYFTIKKKVRSLEAFKPQNVKSGRIDLGMQSAYNMFKDNGRSEASKSLLIITNGYAVSNYGKVSRAQINEVKVRLRKVGVYTTVVGIGFENLKGRRRAQAVREIRQIASSKEHVFTRRFTELLSNAPHKHPIDGSFCPVDGMWSRWSKSKCSKTCGGGTKVRSRKCSDPVPKSGGKACRGNKNEKLPCNTKHCPVDGHWSKWTETKCSKTCGGGKQTRRRTCRDRKYDGKLCKGKTSEVIECNVKQCPIDGQWSLWSSTTCSKPCGGGEITKSRTCKNPEPQHGGKQCAGLAENVIVCNEKNCPIDGNWSPWKQGPCTKSCGGGTSKKLRLCNNPAPQNGGTVCPGRATLKQKINLVHKLQNRSQVHHVLHLISEWIARNFRRQATFRAVCYRNSCLTIESIYLGENIRKFWKRKCASVLKKLNRKTTLCWAYNYGKNAGPQVKRYQLSYHV